MLVIISPAKTLNFSTSAATRKHSVPSFLPQSRQLITTLRNQSPADLAALMGISSKLADLNYQRYADWQLPFTSDNAKQAMLAFKGDVYQGLAADDFTERDLSWAQKHVRILSGLYGLLRPLDLIQPYRLEMGTRLQTSAGSDLYQFWGGRLTDAVNEALEDSGGSRRPVLVNLASNEYFNALDPEKINARIITPTFRDLKDGRYKFISFFAKRARGLMTRYVVKERVSTLKALRAFDWQGYSFSEALSDGDDWVYLRDRPTQD